MNGGLPFLSAPTNSSGQPVGFILAGLPPPIPPSASRTMLVQEVNDLRTIAQACMDQVQRNHALLRLKDEEKEVLLKKLEKQRKREDSARKKEACLAEESEEEQSASRTAREKAGRKRQVIAANSRLGKQPRPGATADSFEKLEDTAAAAGRKEAASADHRVTDVAQQGTDGQASMASHAADTGLNVASDTLTIIAANNARSVAADDADIGTATICSSDGRTVPGLVTVHNSAQPCLEQGHRASGSRIPDERPKAAAQAEPPVVRYEKPVPRRNPPRKARH